MIYSCSERKHKREVEEGETKMTQKEAILEVWHWMPPGEFNLYDFAEKVRDRLRRNNKDTGYISESGLTASMRSIRQEAMRDCLFSLDFDYSVVNGKKGLYLKRS